MTASTLSPADLCEVTVDALHLSITQSWPSGGSNNVHILENGDLGVEKVAKDLISSADDGEVVIALGVDSDHDEVHFSARGTSSDSVEVLQRAVESLTLALDAVRRVGKL